MNGKLREAKTLAERLAAMIVMKFNRNMADNAKARASGQMVEHVLSAADFHELVEPFIELSAVQARRVQAEASKIIDVALRERSLAELGGQETTLLFAIAEQIRRLETP